MLKAERAVVWPEEAGEGKARASEVEEEVDGMECWQ
jgi:hypothetical protein